MNDTHRHPRHPEGKGTATPAETPDGCGCAAGCGGACGDPDDLSTRLEKAEADLNKEHDLFLRTLADFDNYKKRAVREREDLARMAETPVLLELLPVLDSLERAEAAAQQGGDIGQSLLEGLRITVKQFHKGLETLGVAPMEAEGKLFDPALHDALGHKECPDLEPDTVAEVVQKGYLLDGKVLRHAVVRVAKKPEK